MNTATIASTAARGSAASHRPLRGAAARFIAWRVEVKSVLAGDTVGDMHERAILTGASIDFDEDSPAAIVA